MKIQMKIEPSSNIPHDYLGDSIIFIQSNKERWRLALGRTIKTVTGNQKYVFHLRLIRGDKLIKKFGHVYSLLNEIKELRRLLN